MLGASVGVQRPDQTLTTKIVDEFLFENKLLLQAIEEATLVGRVVEAVDYAEKLQERLFELTQIADTQVFHCGPPPSEEELHPGSSRGSLRR